MLIFNEKIIEAYVYDIEIGAPQVQQGLTKSCLPRTRQPAGDHKASFCFIRLHAVCLHLVYDSCAKKGKTLHHCALLHANLRADDNFPPFPDRKLPKAENQT
jgi:hypothetical protein